MRFSSLLTRSRIELLLSGAAGVYLLSALLQFVRASLRWPLVGDATLLHYCVFLLRHGAAPYRELIDINLPGTYFVEWVVIRLFGYGALPWRIFDLLLLLVIAFASLSMVRSGNGSHMSQAMPRTEAWTQAWLPALWVTAVFALLHGRDGLTQLGQRDLLVTALLAGAVAALFRAMRCMHGAACFGCMAAFGLAIGAAATVKPLALILLPCLLLLRFAQLHAELQRGKWRMVAAACIGPLLPLLAALAYLLREHALRACVQTIMQLVPLHSSLFRWTLWHLLTGCVSSTMLPLFLLGLPMVLWSRPWRSFEGAVLLVAMGFGVLSFCLQGRGYPYHRYPLHLFLLVLYARVLPAGLRSAETGMVLRGCALGSLLFGVVVTVPRSLHALERFTPQTDTLDAALHAALVRRGGASLAGKVQCLDMAGGCVTTLLRMELPQSTDYLYDCYAFVPVAAPFRAEQDRYRAEWLRALATNPPQVIIATSDACAPRDIGLYRKLRKWPALGELLRTEYVLSEEWTPTTLERWAGQPSLPYGFRIYTRRR